MNSGKIYIIRPIDDVVMNDDCYFGSTKLDLFDRFYYHVTAYKRWKQGKTNRCSVYHLFDTYGADNCFIQLVEQTLLDREKFYVRNRPCVNINFNNVKRKYSKKPITFIQLYQNNYFKKKNRN
jgi:hypothetical protein